MDHPGDTVVADVDGVGLVAVMPAADVLALAREIDDRALAQAKRILRERSPRADLAKCGRTWRSDACPFPPLPVESSPWARRWSSSTRCVPAPRTSCRGSGR